MKLKSVVCLLCVLMATAFAQDSPLSSKLQANVPFGFVADGKMFPAGHYTFEISGGRVQITNDARNESFSLPSLDRIADKSITRTAQISFEVQDGIPFIEALWPGIEDGYLLHAVKGKHIYSVVNAIVGDGEALAYRR
jgi:hypothetical protein